MSGGDQLPQASWRQQWIEAVMSDATVHAMYHRGQPKEAIIAQLAREKAQLLQLLVEMNMLLSKPFVVARSDAATQEVLKNGKEIPS